MYEYKIEFYVETRKRSVLIDVFKKLRDRSWISSKRDRVVLQTIANDNRNIRITMITKRRFFKNV